MKFYPDIDGAEWILSEIIEPDGTLHLASIDCHVRVGAIYERVEIDPVSPRGHVDER